MVIRTEAKIDRKLMKQVIFYIAATALILALLTLLGKTLREYLSCIEGKMFSRLLCSFAKSERALTENANASKATEHRQKLVSES